MLGVYIIGNVIAYISFRIEFRAGEDWDTMRLVALLDIVADLRDVAGILITVRIVQTISAFEDKLFNRNWHDFFGKNDSGVAAQQAVISPG